jgi:hypothetical protein
MHAQEPEVGTALIAEEWWPILGGCADKCPPEPVKYESIDGSRLAE